MTHQITISSEARRDFDDISDYTLANWGEKQQETYMAALADSIFRLQIDPEKQGRERDDVLSGLRSIAHEDHYFIFYRVEGQTVEILRVLHQRRDWMRFFE